MGLGDEIKHGAEKLGGKMKEKAGEATDNESLAMEGRKDQAAAEIKDAASDLGDKVQRKADELRGKLDRKTD